MTAGDAPDDRPPGPGALAGLTVIDGATFIAAPFAAALMGEFGAEVIKVEQPGAGDPFRRFGTATPRDGDSLAWMTEGRNKRSVTIDLRVPRGADLFRRLVAGADVLCENFRPGTLERWGLGWDALSADNPALVLLRISGYGQTGPYRDRPGFARIAHAFGGLTHLAGHPGGAPVTPGSTSLADYMSGLFGAFGVMAALRARERDGRGQVVDIGLYESVFRILDEMAPRYAYEGHVRQPEGAGTINACPHGHFQCGDGCWVAIACTSDKMFARLAAVLGAPGLATGAFATTAARLAARAEVDGLVSGWTGARSRDDVVEACLDGGVPCAPVNTVADLFADPHIRARGNLVEMMDAVAGAITVPGVVPTLSGTPGRIDHLGPTLGADTDAVLRERLGLDEEAIAALRRDGVI